MTIAVGSAPVPVSSHSISFHSLPPHSVSSQSAVRVHRVYLVFGLFGSPLSKTAFALLQTWGPPASVLKPPTSECDSVLAAL